MTKSETSPSAYFLLLYNVTFKHSRCIMWVKPSCCNPAIVRLVVLGHFCQGDVTIFLQFHGPYDRNGVVIKSSSCCNAEILHEHLVRVFLDLGCFLIVSCGSKWSRTQSHIVIYCAYTLKHFKPIKYTYVYASN